MGLGKFGVEEKPFQVHFLILEWGGLLNNDSKSRSNRKRDWNIQWHKKQKLKYGNNNPNRREEIINLIKIRAQVGEGDGTPLQCSCLENPRDGGAWGLQSMGSRRVGHDWSDLAAAEHESMKMKRERSKKPKADPMERSTDKTLVKLIKKKERRRKLLTSERRVFTTDLTDIRRQ